MDLELPQLAHFLAWLKPGATEEPGDFRSQQPAGFAFALGGIAQDFTHFLFDASPVALGSPTQFVFHFVLKLANNELCHVSNDIMIAYDGQGVPLLPLSHSFGVELTYDRGSRRAFEKSAVSSRIRT